ncbi:sulfonate ABC transporter substrate-binding protein [Metabacillus sediminilitoris]|uniref:Putative aliphatic sulfonates-binding protein n=1 Tax=Metabacillus sediminilitoris TaxID=2567941 RepID=A0A4S4C498_9BACI|nr:sulfonate ABC transporter substrate-binding protein [Metabacillus sediminilitoris]QGQ45335.1 aliphatic sulfonate ABC transporter substrate-binding protein [Metabacillus sediminilitoris]THF82368.1 sulfonate ABC transporter substrate-binding protein [Metabacillus sediminilitoris]
MKLRLLLFLTFSTILAFVMSGCNSSSSGAEQNVLEENNEKTIHIGYQKFGTLNILKANKSLDEALEKVGYSVKWTEFPAGPQLLEALNVGSVDFGHTGEAPPIFAQAADAPLVYFANEPSNPKGEAIIVQENSPIKNIKDLKGKKIGLNKGSNVHYLLVKALEKEGIKYEEIETAFLPPADARAAFEKGDIDAWVIWDPFLADAELSTNARIIADATDLAANREFFLSSRTFAEGNPDVLDVIYDEVKRTEKWVSENPKEAAAFLSPQIGMDVETLELTLNRRTFGLEKVTQEVINDQQKIADQFYELKLIPKELKVEEATIHSK